MDWTEESSQGKQIFYGANISAILQGEDLSSGLYFNNLVVETNE